MPPSLPIFIGLYVVFVNASGLSVQNRSCFTPDPLAGFVETMALNLSLNPSLQLMGVRRPLYCHSAHGSEEQTGGIKECPTGYLRIRMSYKSLLISVIANSMQCITHRLRHYLPTTKHTSWCFRVYYLFKLCNLPNVRDVWNLHKIKIDQYVGFVDD